jgi:hypothetical protein
MSYVNTYDSQKLLDDPMVKPQLARILGPQLTHLESNVGVHGPLGVDGGGLTLSGNAEHLGGEEEGLVFVDLSSGGVYACLLTNGRFEVYGKQPKFDYLPDAVRHWIVLTWAWVNLKGGLPSAHCAMNVSLIEKESPGRLRRLSMTSRRSFPGE